MRTGAMVVLTARFAPEELLAPVGRPQSPLRVDPMAPTAIELGAVAMRESREQRHRRQVNRPMRIRKLSRRDMKPLLAFYQSLSEAVTFLFQPFAEPDDAVIQHHLCGADIEEHLSFGIVADDGTILGHGFVLYIDADEPVFGIGLHQSIHGRGWGRKLMEYVLGEADARRKPLLTLTVLKVNTRARGLYEKTGFVVKGEATFRDCNDSYCMERRPSAADQAPTLEDL